MTDLRQRLVDSELEEVLLADGFDEAFLGVATRCGQPTIAIYDTEKCIDILVTGGMDREEAIEYFEFNVVGAWVGPETPAFVDKIIGPEKADG